MTYKILHGTVHLSKDHFFTNPTRTNGFISIIVTRVLIKDVRSFSQRIIEHWNRLATL